MLINNFISIDFHIHVDNSTRQRRKKSFQPEMSAWKMTSLFIVKIRKKWSVKEAIKSRHGTAEQAPRRVQFCFCETHYYMEQSMKLVSNIKLWNVNFTSASLICWKQEEAERMRRDFFFAILLLSLDLI